MDARALSDRVRSLRLGSEADTPRNRGRFLPWIVCFVLLLTTAAFAYRAYSVGTLPGQRSESNKDSKDDKKSDNKSPSTGSTSVSDDSEVIHESQAGCIRTKLMASPLFPQAHLSAMCHLVSTLCGDITVATSMTGGAGAGKLEANRITSNPSPRTL